MERRRCHWSGRAIMFVIKKLNHCVVISLCVSMEVENLLEIPAFWISWRCSIGVQKIKRTSIFNLLVNFASGLEAFSGDMNKFPELFTIQISRALFNPISRGKILRKSFDHNESINFRLQRFECLQFFFVRGFYLGMDIFVDYMI